MNAETFKHYANTLCKNLPQDQIFILLVTSQDPSKERQVHFSSNTNPESVLCLIEHLKKHLTEPEQPVIKEPEQPNS